MMGPPRGAPSSQPPQRAKRRPERQLIVSRVVGSRLELPGQTVELMEREVTMDERPNVWTSVTLMALVGGVITALLYTDRGRQSLHRVETALDNFGQSLHQLRGTVQKAGLVATQGIDVASESVEVVSQLLGKGQGRQGQATLH